MPTHKLKRCAIYTRKSSEEGLEQNFNSLDAQREACEAFIKSQPGEGWRLAAAELEKIVVAAAGKMLDDRKLLLEAAEQHNLNAIRISELLRIAHERSSQLHIASDMSDELAQILQRIELRPEHIRLTLNLPLPTTAQADAALTLTQELPFQIKRRRVEKRLLITGGTIARRRVV
jgi:hypothetical protein